MNEEALKIIISAEIDRLKAELDKAKNEVENFSKDGEKNLNDFDKSMADAGNAVAKGMAAISMAAFAGGAALLALAASTKDYRNEQAKLTTAFEAAGGSAATATETYNNLYRVLGDGAQATEAAGHLAKLTTEEKALNEWTTICQGVYATFGDSLPIESLTEAANETAKTGELTGALADALNWAGVNEEAFKEQLFLCNTEAEREALIRETLNGLYSDAAAKFEKNNASVIKQNESQAKLDATMAKLGETVAPIITLFTDMGSELLEQLMPTIEQLSSDVMPALVAILGTVGKWLTDLLGFMVEHKELMAVIATAIGVVTTAIGLQNAVEAISTAMKKAEVATVWQLVSAHIAHAAAAMVALAPYILIVAAIAAVIAIIVLCIKHWDDIVAAVKKAWEKMVSIFKGAGEWFSGVFQKAFNGIKKAFSGITNFFSGVWTSIKNIFSKVGETIGGAIKNTVNKAVNGVLSTACKIINGFIKAINFAISVINAIPGVNISKLKELSVPKLARGGIVDGATLAVIGEQGKEAVMPLENNTEWIDELASRLGKLIGNNGGAPIILQVDGKTFAKTAVTTINDLTKQQGKLPLVIA